ncbi:MAG: PorP/SprF family type IX secretion system membrane protein [Chitinophagales bacterium]|nr:PorP/SprF family type IX secretion system membrane protein [Chitinophagales bacterium]MCZ2394118.1 PorP/SprF family type IX secretion system membrane protein [Chitinophagales bacterium]
MKKIRIVLILFICCQLLNNTVLGQDYKFNQFYNSPLNLNPALTGKLKGLFRLGANYRVQSVPVSTPAPYSTLSAAADFGLLQSQLNGDILGVGIIASADNQAGGALKTTDIMASVAYHKSFGRDNNHYLSAGFQFGIKNRRLDISQLYFESQFNPAINGFDMTLPNLESFNTESFTRINMHTGIFWSSNFSSLLSAYAGVSAFNLMRPKDSFFSADSERKLKFHGHGGLTINLNDKIMLNPNGIFMSQYNLMNWVVGSQFSYNLSGKNPYETSVFVGAWYDGGGAIIGSAGVQLKGLQLTLSYDRTISDLSNANNGFGAFETSIIYQSSPINNNKKYTIMACPVF